MYFHYAVPEMGDESKIEDLLNLKPEPVDNPALRLKTTEGKLHNSMKCSLKLINSFNSVFGVTFLLTGLVLIYQKEQGYVIVGPNIYKLLSLSMVINGACLTAYSIFGFFGLKVTSRRHIILIHAVMGIALFVLVLMALLKIPNIQIILDRTKTNLYEALSLYGNISDYRQVWDHLQYKMHCCGVQGYGDWCPKIKVKNDSVCQVPSSCAFHQSLCVNNKHTEDPFLSKKLTKQDKENILF